MLSDSKLDFWFQHNRNVLFVGKHGVGKTAQIKSCFERNGLKHGDTYLYFSASTLDPWVDLVGVPEKTTNAEGQTYLELVRPKALANGNVVAIFFDEFNRSVKKVRNAVMELMQFKSINGLVFPNLKCVWAAINPEEDDVYDVEKIDPAQKDRFHIIQNIPYKPNLNWFAGKYGSDTATAAVEWWEELPEEEKNKVSPRRLEYALDEFSIGGSLQDILPVSTNINKLLQGLKNGPIEAKLKKLFTKNDKVGAKAFLANDNNYFSSIKYILSTPDFMEFYVPLMPKERISCLMADNSTVCRFVTSASETNKDLWNIMREIVIAGQDEKLVKMLHRFVNTDENTLVKDSIPETPAPAHYADKPKTINFSTFFDITSLSTDELDKNFNSIKSSVFKEMDESDALSCMLALAHITKLSWATTLLRPELKLLPNIINHCLQSIKNTTRQNYSPSILECLIQEHKSIGKMFTKCQQAGIFGRILRV
jgi:hypothetical protein